MSYSLDAIYRSSSWSIAKNSQALAALQLKAATGQEINRISDHPTSANQIMGLLNDGRAKTQYLKALDEVIGILDLSASVAQSIFSEFSGARSLLTSSISGTSSPELRNTMATNLNNSLEQLVSLVNTQRLGQSLFGGANSNVPPYAVERNDKGEIVRVVYQGSYQELPVQISDGMQLSPMMVGDRIFRSDSRGEPLFYGQTGAAAGTGTSSVRGDVYLTVTGGPGSWELSIDGGLSSITVDGTEESVAVIHAETGEVIYIDPRGITAEGTEPIRVPGTYDMFNILINARDALQNKRGLSEEQMTRILSDTITAVQQVEEKLAQAFPVIGGRLQILTNLRDSIDEMKMNTEQEISLLQDADMTQVAIDVARYQLLYEMSLHIAAKMFNLSLLDFLR